MNRSYCLFLLVLLTLPLALPLRADADNPAFLAGAAKADVTPQEPVPMWGYGSRRDSLSVGTLDPLQATAIVIQAGDDKLAIVGLDLGRSPSEESMHRIRQRIKESAGIAHSFLAGSHTHHGPVLELSDQEGRGKGKFDASIRYQQLEDAIVGASWRPTSSWCRPSWPPARLNWRDSTAIAIPR